jgi:hypothetical protein
MYNKTRFKINLKHTFITDLKTTFTFYFKS